MTMFDFLNHFQRGNSAKIKVVSSDIVNIILSETGKRKNHLAWKIGKRLREASDNGELAGNIGIVWSYLQTSIEVDTNKRISVTDLYDFRSIYDLFTDSFEDLGKVSFGSAKAIARRFSPDKKRAVNFLSECVQHRYSEQQIKSILWS